LRHFLRKPEVLILLVSAWIALTCNLAYWRVVASNIPTGELLTPLYFFSVALVTVGLIYTVMLILAIGPVARLVLGLALVVAAAAGYFTDKFGILFDTGMLVNVIETNTAEALELLSPSLIATVTAFGVVPALIVWRFPMVARRLPIAILERGVAVIIALGFIAGPLYLNQKEIFSLGRNHREIRHMIAPLNVISATYSHVRDSIETPAVYRQLALDASHVEAIGEDIRPSVHVLIVGETARAASFSLNGHLHNTNPELAQQSNVQFIEATSCGTATAMSLPCMFAIEQRGEFQSEFGRTEDNLLDIAARAGYAVHWVDNGNGCKGVCARVDSRDVHLSDVDHICPDGECYDEILVHELKSLLSSVTDDTLIVLHQLGSHGPAYFRRYPDDYRAFLPDCRSANLGDCSIEAISNSYDNTILYTDHVISSAIDALAAESDRINASLIYMSDHGESLGEHNLYLHGMPYQFAPDEQTHIPMITWFGAEVGQDSGLQSSCTSRDVLSPVSHDNLFHTELGMLGIETSVYNPAMDIFAPCRNQALLITAGNVPANRS